MTQEVPTADQKRLANQRRQAYWKRRRTVQSMAKRGPKIVPEKMMDGILWGQVALDLSQLLDEAAMGASPKHLELVMRIDACVRELMLRGTQGTLFQ